MALGQKSKIGLDFRIALITRVIGDVVNGAFGSYSRLFNGYENIVNTIDKGVRLEYVERVRFLGCTKGDIVCTFLLQIDWNKHRVMCSSHSEKEYVFGGNEDVSIAEQVSKALPRFEKFIRDSVEQEGVERFVVYYFYRDGVDGKKANVELGLVDLSSEDNDKLHAFEKNATGFSLTPGGTKELTFIFLRKSKPTG
jgi:hypothetical protein